MTLPQAVLCDMDGTLVDTEPYWEDAKIRLAAKHGIAFTADDAAPLVGRSMMITIQALQQAGVPLNEEDVLSALVDEVAERVGKGIPWIPGAQEFLRRMEAAALPCALVTQAWAPVASHIIDASNGVLQALVSGGDVAHPKPHPEPYLLAAGLLGVDPARCIALEDSPAGVASAEAAGAQVIVMPGAHQVDAGPNRHPVESLEEIDLGLFERLMDN